MKREKNILLTIFSVACFQMCMAQNQHKIDSLLNVLKTASADTNKVIVLNALSYRLQLKGDYDKSKKYADEALQLSEKINYRKGIGKAYNNMGILNDYLGNYPEALKNHFASLKISEEIGDKKGTADSYCNIAGINILQANYPEGLKYIFASLKIFEELENKGGISSCYTNIAVIYSRQGNHAEGLKNFSASLKINEEIGDKYEVSNSYINIGTEYWLLKNYPEALKNYFAGLKIKEEIGDKSGIAYAHHGIGNSYEKQGDFTNALKNYFVAQKIAEETEDKNLIANCYNNIGIVYSHSGEYAFAIDYLNKGLDLAKIIGAKDITKNSYNDLSNLYEKKNDFKNAFKFQKLYFQMNDSLLNEAKSEQLTEMKTKYETEQKEKEIALLTKDKEIQNIAIKKQKVLKYFFIGGLALTILLFFFGYRIYRARQVLRLQTIRNRIADDLHDDIGSTLNSISVYSEVAKQKSPAVVQELEQIGEASRKIIDAMSDIVWTINTKNDTFEQIILRLRSLTYNLLRAKNIEHTFRADESLNDMKLSMELRRNFYLIFKEVLNNLVKYSNASRVSISLRHDNNLIALGIRDNGVGFDVKQTSTGNGLLSMKNRAEEMKAELKIESEQGKGTTVELKLRA